MRNDDLCERLKRYSTKCLAERLDPDFADAVKEAADEIEELEKDADSLGDQVDALYGALPKWIPMTERLPNENGEYIVSGKGKVWVCEFMIFGGICGWCNSAMNPCVEYWMPLLKPPEDGETWM